MATFTLASYSTGSVTLADLRDTMAAAWNYQAQVPDPNNPGQMIANPESKVDFNHRQIGRIIRELYTTQKRKEAREAAEAAIVDAPIGP